MRHIIIAIFLTLFFQVAFWVAKDKTVLIADTHSSFQSLSYTPYKGFKKELQSPEEIKRDLEILKTYTKKIRLYSAGDAEAVIPLIEGDDLIVDLGIWLSSNKEENEKEIEKAFKLITDYPKKIMSVIVGNEVLLRKDLSPDELIEYIKRVDDFTRKPITTAEDRYNWTVFPKVANNVDYITLHILPYWESVNAKTSLQIVYDSLYELKNTFPNKLIVIGEFGWPSQGYNNKDAIPSPEIQADVIRQFLTEADKNKWVHNIVEAFDQPWKGKIEGSVGPYWGVFTADRVAKFELKGAMEINPLWFYQMLASMIIGAFLTYFGLKTQRVNFAHSFTFALASQGMAFGLVMAATYPFENYMNFGMWVMWIMGLILMIPLTVITLAKINELFKCTIGRPPERLVPLNLKTDRVPFVSIHVPAYKEQPHVLKETLKALSELNYTNYEVLVIINNTKEDYYKQPIKEYCEELGEKFKYLDIVCTGFKAGALNEALKYTDENAEILAVIDADYVIKPNWLIDLVPLFDDPKVALVQAPQDHRDGDESLIKTAMNAEYAGFFDIGMIERNEENAIVAHGTMLLLRLKSMIEVGSWGTDTIVEDSELGLRLFEAGYTAHYTNRRYGYGLLPDTIQAFKTQRHRWAYGAIQILKKHWRHFTPSSTTLTPFQKYHFVAGWFFWLSDAFGAIMAFLNIIWVPVIILVGVTIPTIALTVPILIAFLVNILHAFILYKTRVKINFTKSLLSAIAAMSLQLIIFKAVFDGFIKDGLPFKRTEKGGNSNKSRESPVKYEMILAILLLLSAVALFISNSKNGIIEVYLFAITLVIQSIPYVSAIILRWIEIYSNRVKS